MIRKIELFPNRTEAILAAESDARSRGYSSEQAYKYCACFPRRLFGQDKTYWEAWTIHHIVNGKVYRRPICQ